MNIKTTPRPKLTPTERRKLVALGVEAGKSNRAIAKELGVDEKMVRIDRQFLATPENGDAVHVMPPFGAHGANTALRDAKTLGKRIVQSGTGIEGLVGRINAYEVEMRVYSRNAVKEASRMMTMATADVPFKNKVFQTILKTGSRFSRQK